VGGTAAGDHEPNASRAAVELRRYVDEIDRPTQPGDSALKRVVKRLLPYGIRHVLRLAVTDAGRPIAARRARYLVRQSQPVLVQLGSGRAPKPGWINVDMLGKGADVALNIRRPLPFGDGTVDAVFHEHLLEHLSLADGRALTRELYRVLRPGGIVRIVVPDAGLYARSYVEARTELERLRPGRPTAMLALQEVFLRHGHRTAYDFETLELVLVASGFEDVRHCGFGESALPEAPDGDHRRAESVYVEATKPDDVTG
jgi:predicted SAM-dependent methyltransferase